MGHKGYTWDIQNNTVPEIQPHSITKLKILREYLIEYCKARTVVPQMDSMRLTVIDGFSGGGLYTYEDDNIKGSPLVCLQAVKEAEYLINENRNKKIKLDVDFIFVEAKKDNILFLRDTLQRSEYSHQLDKNILLFHGKFENYLEKIISLVKRKSKQSGYSIFILDQYGYSSIPVHMIHRIFNELKKPEIILTFNVDAIFARANSIATPQALDKLGLDGQSIMQGYDHLPRPVLQERILKNLISKCGVPFFTPFFIRNQAGYGDYWLIHMSAHATARNVMVENHYQHYNHFIHYGKSGLQMFGYDPFFDPNVSRQSDFSGISPEFDFSDKAKQTSILEVAEDIPYYLDKKGTTNFASLFINTCNNSPATRNMYAQSLQHLIDYQMIEVIGQNGEKRQRGTNIKDTDIIRMLPQRRLFFIK